MLTKGDITSPEPVLVRMHALDPMVDVLGLNPAKTGEMGRAMEAIAKEGRGVVVLLRETAMKLAQEFPEQILPEYPPYVSQMLLLFFPEQMVRLFLQEFL